MKIRCDGSCGCKGELVELWSLELEARDLIEGFMGEGLSLQAAVDRLRARKSDNPRYPRMRVGGMYHFRRLSADFWDWMLGVPARELLDRRGPITKRVS